MVLLAWDEEYHRGTESLIPATIEGIGKYSGSGLISGIAPVTGRRIRRSFSVRYRGGHRGSPRQARGSSRGAALSGWR